MVKWNVISISGVILLSACASPLVKSEKLTSKEIAGSNARADAGVVEYYLPRKRVQFDIKAYPTKDEIDALKQEISALKKFDKENSKDKKNSNEMENKKKISEKQLALFTLEAQLEDGNESNCREKVEMTVLKAEPDLSARFEARLLHAAVRDDLHEIKLTEDGLLMKGTVTSTDKSLDIATQLAKTAATFFNPLPGAAFAPRPCPRFSLTKIVDPMNDSDIKQLNDEINTKKGKSRIKVDKADVAKIGEVGDKVTGFVYRRAAPVYIHIQKIKDDNTNTRETVVVERVDLPQAGGLAVLPVYGGRFTKTAVEYDFNAGLPTRFKADRKSEAWELATFPLEVMSAIFKAPTDLIQLKIDTGTEKKAAPDTTEK